MIGKDLARQIHNCHGQIETCDKLVNDMAEVIEKHGDEKLIDAFGERRGLQLGVPTGSNSHRLFNVSPEMAIKVINEHKEFNQRELKRLNGLALIQCQGA